MSRLLQFLLPYFFFLLSFLLLIFSSCAAPRKVQEIEQPPPTEAEDVREILVEPHLWSAGILEQLSLEEKVAQMLVPRASGYYISRRNQDWQRLVRLVKERKIGGICLFQGDVYESAVLINTLQEMADVPLLVSADFERGLAMRTRRTTPFPEAMAVAATRSSELAFRMGTIVAKEARALGVHQNYAPVVDVNRNPNNPVINVRAYGEDPSWVSEIASAYAAGMQDGGVIATAKHFPGHGDTEVDSHIGLPTLNFTRERLDSVELLPFRRLIDRGVMSIMVGHLFVPALDTTRRLPATISAPVVEGLLRGEMGFGGLIVSDALDMGGLVGGFDVEEASVRAVQAGLDLIIVPPVGTEEGIINAIVRAVYAGRISEEQINRAVRRILNAKEWLGLENQRTVDLDTLAVSIGTAEHWELARTIARQSITLLKNDGVLPIARRSNGSKLLTVAVSDVADYRTEVHRPGQSATNERVGSYFNQEVRKRWPGADLVVIDPRSNRLDFDSTLVRAQRTDLILCPIYVKARSGAGRFGLPPKLIEFLNLLTLQKKPVVFIAMGNPYILAASKSGNAYLSAYTDGEVSTEAVVEALFGEIPISGRLPVTIPDLFTIGSGVDYQVGMPRVSTGTEIERFSPVDSIVLAAIRDRAFPGAQLVVLKDGIIIHNKSYGTLTYDLGSPAVADTTLYDLASLTKVIATTPAIMKLIDDGIIGLDDPVSRYIPEFKNGLKDKITIRHLLLHTSGLPAFKKLYQMCRTAEEAIDSVVNARLIYSPNDSTLYSDFGFILLGKIVERVSGITLDRYVREKFFAPLGMERTMFSPPASRWNATAPTEMDAEGRSGIIQGTVHDGNAWLLGGVAGHAGSFSTASDLAVMMQMVMNGGAYGGRQFLKPETVKLFTQRQNQSNSRALGWDMKSPTGYSAAGSFFGRQSFGHLGFTGTSIWADPDRNLCVILLTNRVYPTRASTKIQQIRPALHDAVVKALLK